MLSRHRLILFFILLAAFSLLINACQPSQVVVTEIVEVEKEVVVTQEVEVVTTVEVEVEAHGDDVAAVVRVAGRGRKGQAVFPLPARM